MADHLQVHQTLDPGPHLEDCDLQTTKPGAGVASISSFILRCFKDFQNLLDTLSNHDEHSSARSKVGEELGRLRVWAGNFGAHRNKQTGYPWTTGLERLQIYTERSEITSSAYLSTSPEPKVSSNVMDGEDSDSESSDSDGFWEQIRTEGLERSHIDVYADDLSHTVTSLYKLSLSLQNPAHRDRTAQASRIDLHNFEAYDIHHVCNKFKLTPNNNLAQRLGRANTKRRQLLAYHKDHSDKISKYIDVALNKAVSAPPLPVKIDLQSEPQQRPPTISTRWTQGTTVSTIYQEKDVTSVSGRTRLSAATCFKDADLASDSGRTRFSAATSTMGAQDQILVPPPPSGPGVTKRDPFICLYCYQTVQVDNDEDWTYHVYSDLRPYICTFGGCVKENQLYDSFTEWSAHERQFHRREWFCTLCQYTSGEKSSFIRHLDDHHTDVPKEQRQEMTKQSKSSTLAQQCPICIKPPISDSSRFQQHLAQHLQQLALFVLPRGEADDEGSAAREEESNESLHALAMASEDRESLLSISADSRTWSSISGFQSPIGGRSLDAIPQETMNEASDVGDELEGTLRQIQESVALESQEDNTVSVDHKSHDAGVRRSSSEPRGRDSAHIQQYHPPDVNDERVDHQQSSISVEDLYPFVRPPVPDYRPSSPQTARYPYAIKEYNRPASRSNRSNSYRGGMYHTERPMSMHGGMMGPPPAPLYQHQPQYYEHGPPPASSAYVSHPYASSPYGASQFDDSEYGPPSDNPRERSHSRTRERSQQPRRPSVYRQPSSYHSVLPDMDDDPMPEKATRDIPSKYYRKRETPRERKVPRGYSDPDEDYFKMPSPPPPAPRRENKAQVHQGKRYFVVGEDYYKMPPPPPPAPRREHTVQVHQAKRPERSELSRNPYIIQDFQGNPQQRHQSRTSIDTSEITTALPERGRRVSREARTPERSHSLDNNKGSTSSQDSTRACAGSDNGESKNMNLMVNGVPVGFTEESVSGKHITIRAGDTGRVQLYIDGNRRPKQYLMRGSSYSRDQTAYSDPGESTKR